MAVINTIVTIGIAVFLLWGAAFSYRHYAAEQRFIERAGIAARNDIANANASLPKWDNKNYKGLTYRP